MIAQHALRRAAFRTPAGRMRSGAVLPFFDARLEVKFLLVLRLDGRCVVVRDLPDRVEGRILTYTVPARLDREIGRKPPAELVRTFHFDPWWLLKGRESVPARVRDRVVRTNLALRNLGAGDLRRLWFDDSLRRVVAGRTSGRRLAPDDLVAALRPGARRA